jgi:NAD(P)-dependent dehydrogenase (short-subunit alcohol dehydrogenase family)
MLFAISLAEKLGSKGVLVFSLHPGVIFTNLARHNAMEEFEGLGK